MGEPTITLLASAYRRVMNNRQDAIAEGHAAGYAEGQRVMRLRAARRADAFDHPVLVAEIMALPINQPPKKEKEG